MFLALRYWRLLLGAAAIVALVIHYEGVPLVRKGRVQFAYERGLREERLVWTEAARKAEAARAAERRRAAVKLAELELEHLAAEEAADKEFKDLSDDLERRLAEATALAGAAQCSVGGSAAGSAPTISRSVLEPLRRLAR